jgi:transcriptional regulator
MLRLNGLSCVLHRQERLKEGSMNIKGSLPLLILNVLAQEPAHGYKIAKDIKARSGNVLDFKEGTLYPALHSLEHQGLLDAYEKEENGRTRRYYRLTKGGARMLEKERREWIRYTTAVNAVIGGAG